MCSTKCLTYLTPSPEPFLPIPPIPFLQNHGTFPFIMADSADIQASPPISSIPSPSSSSSSSSSSFEFSIARSPSSKQPPAQLCPADELFYRGQLLPLHLSPRLSLVRSILLSSSSSSTSCSDATSITASRDSNGSSSSADSLGLLHRPDPDSSRPSSATEEDCSSAKRRYFSSFTTRFPSFFLNRGNKKNPTFSSNHNSSSSSSKKSATTHPPSPKEMIRKYLEKVKPLIEKLSSLQHRTGPQQKKKSFSLRRAGGRTEILSSSHTCSRSLAENYLRSPYRRKSAASCPSSMRSSPSHSRLMSSDLMSAQMSSSSSMEELQSAIQAAIAHCKSTMAKQKKSMTAASSFEDDICVF